jgi:hypothetical protein
MVSCFIILLFTTFFVFVWIIRNCFGYCNGWDIVLGGVMVIVLAIGPKVRGFKPGLGQWIFKGEKIRSTTSFEGEVKLSAPCCKILWQIEDFLEL